MLWLDRKNHKESLRTWIKNYNYITLNASSIREIEDIENCFKNHLQNDFDIGVAVLNSGLINNKFDLLESLVLDLKGKTNFTNFYNFLSNLGKNDDISVTLEIGTHIQADSVNLSEITQNFHQQKPKDVLKEENANEFLDKFVDDLSNSSVSSFLLIIKLLEADHAEFSEELIYWLKEKFLKKVRTVRNVKIIFLYHEKSEMKIRSEKHIDIDETINYTDIYEMIKIHHQYSNEVAIKVAQMLISTDGINSYNVKYRDASRHYHNYCKLESDQDQICPMKIYQTKK